MPNIFVQGGCSNLKKKIHCLPRQLQHLFHLPIIPPWHSWRPRLFLLPTTELGNMLGRRQGSTCWIFSFLQQLFMAEIISSLFFYAEQHSRVHCIYKTSDSSHCSLLGTSQLINLFPEMPCPRTKAVGEATAVAALSGLCRMETLLHVPCRLCSNLCTPRWYLLGLLYGFFFWQHCQFVFSLWSAKECRSFSEKLPPDQA